MPETRVATITYGPGGYDPTKPNNNVVETKTRIVSDEELAEEAKQRADINLIMKLAANNPTRILYEMLVKKGILP